ncbi:DNA helicase [Hoeflea sp. TYP-13]|uniref:DNA helicase n=1 Tax=Hoeflea sp. TYP-13 TaxID=3230023 RepID=UPI0034C5E33A
MKLSAPIYHLKRRAKALSREKGISLNQALDHIATEEGFNGWSLLAARASAPVHAVELLNALQPGDLVLLGARPGHGKTILGLELLLEAMKSGHRGVFFTLEYNEGDVLNRLQMLVGDPAVIGDRFEFDNSDAISSDYIMKQLASAPRGTAVVIDYLQLLDQKRENPELATQVSALKSFAGDRGLIIIFISQIDRSYDLSARRCPDLRDVRLPNPVDLKLFNKTFFLNDGEVRMDAVG